MAKRSSVLGNDPFRKGAAARPPEPPIPSEERLEADAVDPLGFYDETSIPPEEEEADSFEEQEPAEDPTDAHEPAHEGDPEDAEDEVEPPPPFSTDRDPREQRTEPETYSETGEWGETLERLTAAIRAAGAGVAALEMGEELVRTMGTFERSLRALVGPSLTADVQAAITDLSEVGRRVVQTSRRRTGGQRSEAHTDFDSFGRDPELARTLAGPLEVLYRKYFRVELEGIENIPAKGRCLLVANHSGAVPWDSLVLATAIALEHPSPRPFRPLLEDFVFHFPFVGTFLNRFGGVRACPENAERLLDEESIVGVFPEGLRGLGKLYRNRHQLERFGRGGFVKLALRTGTPLIPVAIVGADDAHPILCKNHTVARPFGLPFVPVTPTFPLLGPFGLMPLPSKWKIKVGEPLDLEGATPEEAKSRLTVNRLAEGVRDRIQLMVDEMNEGRGNPYF